MSSRITIRNFTAPTAEELATRLRELSSDFSQIQVDASGSANTFILFWGPPTATEAEIKGVLESACLPDGTALPAIGASASFILSSEAGAPDDPWSVTWVRSRHNLAHAAVAPSPSAVSTGTPDDIINEQIDKLIEGFPRHKEYFQSGYGISQERRGADQVEYNRPAYLLVFLPGLGHRHLDERDPIDYDYLFCEVLSDRVSRGVPIFGGSATPSYAGNTSPWLAINTPAHAGQVIRDRRMVAILVETDLAFGYAAGHGFKQVDPPSPGPCKSPHPVRPKRKTSTGTAGERLTPPRTHEIRLPDHLVRFIQEPLDPQRTPGEIPLLASETSEWHSLLVFESRKDSFPCPPYLLTHANGQPKKTFAVLHPLPEGAMLYPATISAEQLKNNLTSIYDEAETAGRISTVAGALVMCCQGRIRLLGPGAIASDLSTLAERLASSRSGDSPTPAVPVFGMYGNGEVCPSLIGVNWHRTWSTAILLFGSNYNRRYLNAARLKWHSEIDRHTSKHETEEAIKSIVDAIVSLTDASSCHIRILSNDGAYLEKQSYSFGELSRIIPKRLAVTEGTNSCEPLALDVYHAYRNHRHLLIKTMSRAEYKKRGSRNYHNWERAPRECRPVIDETQHWISCPIPGRWEECLGVITITTKDLDALSSSRRLELEKLLVELAESAAPSIGYVYLHQWLKGTLSGLSGAENLEQLRTCFRETGSGLISSQVCLFLMLPDKKKETLRCEGIFGAEGDLLDQGNINASIKREATPEEKGIAGWLYLNGESDYYADDVSKLNDPNAEPFYRNCFNQRGNQGPNPGMEIRTQYSVLIQDARGKQCGVMIAESPNEMQIDQKEVIKELALACGRVLDRSAHVQAMEQVVPKQLIKILEDRSEPSQRTVTLFNADVRGFTKMSRIVGEASMKFFLNEYYRETSRVIAKSGGTLDKFMGDGVLAIFGDDDQPEIRPVEKDGDLDLGPGSRDPRIIGLVERALDAAFETYGIFQTVKKKWMDHWKTEHFQLSNETVFDLGVVIHTGRPLIGAFGMEPDGGTGGRVSYTAIGRDVNLVSRISEVTGIWITGTTASYLEHSAKYEPVWNRRRKYEELKGINDPVNIYGVQPRGETEEVSGRSVSKINVLRRGSNAFSGPGREQSSFGQATRPSPRSGGSVGEPPARQEERGGL